MSPSHLLPLKADDNWIKQTDPPILSAELACNASSGNKEGKQLGEAQFCMEKSGKLRNSVLLARESVLVRRETFGFSLNNISILLSLCHFLPPCCPVASSQTPSRWFYPFWAFSKAGCRSEAPPYLRCRGQNPRERDFFKKTGNKAENQKGL